MPLDEDVDLGQAGHIADHETIHAFVNGASAAYQSKLLIAETVLAVDTATVTFSSIPQTFRDLLLVARCRSTRAANNVDEALIRLNGDTGANYDSGYAINNGAWSTETAATSAYGGVVTGAAPAAGKASTLRLLIPAYRAAGLNRNLHLDVVTQSDTTLIYQTEVAAGWRSTAAVTSVSLASRNAANFLTGSSFALYGIV